MTVVLGEMDVARVNPYRSGHGERPKLGMLRTPPASGGHPIPGGGGLKVSLLPGADVHSLGPDDIVRWGGGGMTLGGNKKRDRLKAESGSHSFKTATPTRPAQMTAFHVNLLPRRSRKTLHSQIGRGCYKDTKNAGTRTSTVIFTESVGGRLGIPCNA